MYLITLKGIKMGQLTPDKFTNLRVGDRFSLLPDTNCIYERINDFTHNGITYNTLVDGHYMRLSKNTKVYKEVTEEYFDVYIEKITTCKHRIYAKTQKEANEIALKTDRNLYVAFGDKIPMGIHTSTEFRVKGEN